MQYRLALLPLLAGLAACDTAPVRETVPELPLQPGAGAADPTRQAVLSAAYVFADPSRVAGRPADAARAAAQLEWLAASLPGDSRWIGAAPVLFPQLLAARAALRDSLFLAPSASAASVVQALLVAAVALDSGNDAGGAAALAPVSTGGGVAVLFRLRALPAEPRIGRATSFAQEEMLRMGRDDPE